MLHGAQLAVEEANAGGGYGGKPFKLMPHNDYNNWQAKAVYGDVRPTDPAIWARPPTKPSRWPTTTRYGRSSAPSAPSRRTLRCVWLCARSFRS